MVLDVDTIELSPVLELIFYIYSIFDQDKLDHKIEEALAELRRELKELRSLSTVKDLQKKQQVRETIRVLSIKKKRLSVCDTKKHKWQCIYHSVAFDWLILIRLQPQSLKHLPAEKSILNFCLLCACDELSFQFYIQLFEKRQILYNRESMCLWLECYEQVAADQSAL